MEKFIPYEKLSKKKRRELDRQRRGTWGHCNPVTRRPENPKAYHRKKARRWSMDSGSVPFLYSAAGAISRVTAWGPSAPPVTDRAVSGTRVKICQI